MLSESIVATNSYSRLCRRNHHFGPLMWYPKFTALHKPDHVLMLSYTLFVESWWHCFNPLSARRTAVFSGSYLWNFSVKRFDLDRSIDINLKFQKTKGIGDDNNFSKIINIGAPVFVSNPHFYQADPSLLDAVEGLKPNKTLHDTFFKIQPVRL